MPYFTFVVDRIGRRGLGPERGRYELRQVVLLRNGWNQVVYDGDDQTLRSLPPAEPEQAPPLPPASTVTVELQTPLRIKQNGKLTTRLDFAAFFSSLARRLSLLSAFYGQNGPPDLSGLQTQACQVKTVKDQTFWYDWPRYSTRQKELMKLGGPSDSSGLLSMTSRTGPLCSSGRFERSFIPSATIYRTICGV